MITAEQARQRKMSKMSIIADMIEGECIFSNSLTITNKDYQPTILEMNMLRLMGYKVYHSYGDIIIDWSESDDEDDNETGV